MPLKILPLQERDIPAFAALDGAAMGHLGLARAMSLSAPPDAPPRREMIENWARKSFAASQGTNLHCLKVVDTDLPARDGACDENQIISAAFWSFERADEVSDKDKAQVTEEFESGGEKEEKKANLGSTGVGFVMSQQWEQLKRDFFPNRPYANLKVLVTHPDHQRRGAGSMLIKWGTDEADKRGIISVLQATQMGVGCYLKNGFEVVREDVMDLKPFGVDEIESRRGMIREPKPSAERQ